jgi:regulator of nucleoside diphosphate kinase
MSSEPAILLRADQSEQLTNLALRMAHRSPELSRLILKEVERAELRDAEDFPAEVVAIGSQVEFVDEGSGSVRRVTLVMPSEADIEAGRVSAITPVGIGLIGLRAGQAIDWPRHDGTMRKLRVRSVSRAEVI